MYNKEDLSSNGISELLDIAKEFGAEVEINDKMGKEDIIYAILDKQAEGDSLLGTKRRRTRIGTKLPRATSLHPTVQTMPTLKHLRRR